MTVGCVAVRQIWSASNCSIATGKTTYDRFLDMSILNQNLSGVVLTICLILVFSQSGFAGDEWLPVTPEELSMKQGKVESDADAEAIFWVVRLAWKIFQDNFWKNDGLGLNVPLIT